MLHCYSDSDLGGCTKTSRSNSGYVMIYAKGAISHGAAKGKLLLPLIQLNLVTAASETAKEVIWLCRLIPILGIVNLREIPIIQEDNRAAAKLSYNPKYHRGTKHIEIKPFTVG
ncbi:integrase catalytic domain-containing protein [Trichonephila inaurata madagascariensis]|uniref:Integrase catalytic domain-containing protein n=1 Tax=Trichonephila inaurata madagascariensis TaxID=2747483 RepID=A0A8X7BUR8_9ARAC|nr:integrase catalytic domain-containing protein [Trichonephila inaurata madagascariensis]